MERHGDQCIQVGANCSQMSSFFRSQQKADHTHDRQPPTLRLDTCIAIIQDDRVSLKLVGQNYCLPLARTQVTTKVCGLLRRCKRNNFNPRRQRNCPNLAAHSQRNHHHNKQFLEQVQTPDFGESDECAGISDGCEQRQAFQPGRIRDPVLPNSCQDTVSPALMSAQ
jgi:hypothetical protein